MTRFDRNDPFVPDFIIVEVTGVPVNGWPSALAQIGYITSASAWILCRASQRNVLGESLVVWAKDGFKALCCLCMHDRCL